MNELNQYAVAKVTLFDRLRWKLFPEPSWPRREDDSRTYLSTRLDVHLDWFDRLRVLWSGHVVVKCTTYTDVLVNEAESISIASVAGR